MNRKKAIIIGYIHEYYYLLTQYMMNNEKINRLREKISTPKSPKMDSLPSCSSKTRDEILADTTTKIVELEQKNNKLSKRVIHIQRKLKLKDLTEEENQLISKVFVTLESYDQIASDMQLSRTQVFRMLNKLYDKLAENCGFN